MDTKSSYPPREESNENTFTEYLVVLAISFAVPTFGQEQNTVDPEVRQQIEAVRTQFAEAFNKHHAAAVAAIYAEDAIEVVDGFGVFFSREAIEKD